MSIGQADFFLAERIVAVSPLRRTERAADSGDPRDRKRRPQPAPEENAEKSDADAAPQDVIEWSAALQKSAAAPAALPSLRPALPAANSEARRLDVTV